MSSFDERVRALIEDRVNDLERLFLTAESTPAHSQSDCCKVIIQKLNDDMATTNEIYRTLNSLKKSLTINYFDETIYPIADDDENGGSDDPGIEGKDGFELPDWLQTGIPPTIKDLLQLLGDIALGNVIVKSSPHLLKWLLRHLPEVMSAGAIIPFFNLITSLWRGINDATQQAMTRNDLKQIEADLSRMRGKLDDVMKLLNEFAYSGSQPGGDISMLLDRLQDLIDNTTAYYEILAGLGRQNVDLQRELHADTVERLDLLRSDGLITESDIQCILRWLKGDRSCEEYEVDLISMLEMARDCCNTVRCNLDDYYANLTSLINDKFATLEEHCGDMQREINDLKNRLTDPGNPLDHIDDSLERGNVVGTGSLVLNYAHDLNIIKAQLAEIRRLL